MATVNINGEEWNYSSATHAVLKDAKTGRRLIFVQSGYMNDWFYGLPLSRKLPPSNISGGWRRFDSRWKILSTVELFYTKGRASNQKSFLESITSMFSSEEKYIWWDNEKTLPTEWQVCARLLFWDQNRAREFKRLFLTK